MVPMPATVQQSDSVIASLCREAAAIRARSRQLVETMEACRHRGLLERLAAELRWLQRRRQELQVMARGWQRRGAADPLALAFLLELASRPLPAVGPDAWGMAHTG
jgi:hypothetical protein